MEIQIFYFRKWIWNSRGVIWFGKRDPRSTQFSDQTWITEPWCEFFMTIVIFAVFCRFFGIRIFNWFQIFSWETDKLKTFWSFELQNCFCTPKKFLGSYSKNWARWWISQGGGQNPPFAPPLTRAFLIPLNRLNI